MKKSSTTRLIARTFVTRRAAAQEARPTLAPTEQTLWQPLLRFASRRAKDDGLESEVLWRTPDDKRAAHSIAAVWNAAAKEVSLE